LNERFFVLVDRSTDMEQDIDWALFAKDRVRARFFPIFNNQSNVHKEAYFDKMTHFDFKTLLPALLHVEDRMSMAHGLESRVPLLDHLLVEKVATAPSNVKFKNGELKRLLKRACGDLLPASVAERKDKMGFPVPLTEWIKGDLKGFVTDVFQTGQRRGRPFFDYDAILRSIGKEAPFGRKVWGLLSLELWQQEF